MSKKLLFNFNREVIQNYTYVKYVGTIITATNTLEKPIKSAILKGSTKYRDIDTGEILEAFEEGRNLELVSVKMPVLMAYTNLFTGFVAFGYIGGDGNVVELQGNILSDFIEIHEKTIAFRTFRENGEPSTRYGEFAFYDNNKNFIGRKISSDTTDEYTTVPDGTKYVRIWSVPLDGLGLNTKGMMIYTKDKPSLAITKYLESNKTNILTVNEDVTLRSNGDVYDELNLLTGRLTQRIDENNEVLVQEVVKTVDLSIVDQDGNKQTELNYFNNGYISVSSDKLIPNLEYKVTSNNYFEVSNLVANKTYTLRYDGTINTMTIGGKTFNSPSNNSLITVETLQDNILFISDGSVTDLMLIEGDVRNEEVEYFENMISIKSLDVSVIGKAEQPVFGKGGRK